MFSEQEEKLLHGHTITKIVLFCKRMYHGRIIDDIEEKYYFFNQQINKVLPFVTCCTDVKLGEIIHEKAKKFTWIRVFVDNDELLFVTRSRVFDITYWDKETADEIVLAEPDLFKNIEKLPDDEIKTGISFYDPEEQRQVLICDRMTALRACSVLIKNKSPFVSRFIQFAGQL